MNHSGGIGHVHHFEAHQRLVDFKRLGHNSDKCIAVRSIGDVEVFAIGEAMRPFHKCRRSDWGRVLLCNILLLHRRRSPVFRKRNLRRATSAATPIPETSWFPSADMR
jgi:hypothetical protein